MYNQQIGGVVAENCVFLLFVAGKLGSTLFTDKPKQATGEFGFVMIVTIESATNSGIIFKATFVLWVILGDPRNISFLGGSRQNLKIFVTSQ